jgi:cbb3-type cytochrome c oxidase subunit III
VRRAVVALGILALSGCGTGGLADEAATGNGQQLFREKCGGCHTLADAGTRGTIGPDLDDAFAAPRKEGFDEGSIREVVLDQMRFPVEPMPAPDEQQMFPPGEYSETQREEALNAIASYVASVAAQPTAAAGGGGQSAAGETDPKALFSGNCASCHTLQAAGSTGTIGPNLDRTTLALGAIERQIRRGGSGMPPFEGTLSDEQIKALAKFVADNRGK